MMIYIKKLVKITSFYPSGLFFKNNTGKFFSTYSPVYAAHNNSSSDDSAKKTDTDNNNSSSDDYSIKTDTDNNNNSSDNNNNFSDNNDSACPSLDKDTNSTDTDTYQIEEFTQRLISKYSGKPEEFLDYKKKKVDGLCQEFKQDVKTLLEDRKENRAELSGDEREEYDKNTEKDLDSWYSDFSRELNASNRSRDDVLDAIGNDEFGFSGSKDEAIKNKVSKFKDKAIDSYYGNNNNNLSSSSSSESESSKSDLNKSKSVDKPSDTSFNTPSHAEKGKKRAYDSDTSFDTASYTGKSKKRAHDSDFGSSIDKPSSSNRSNLNESLEFTPYKSAEFDLSNYNLFDFDLANYDLSEYVLSNYGLGYEIFNYFPLCSVGILICINLYMLRRSMWTKSLYVYMLPCCIWTKLLYVITTVVLFIFVLLFLYNY